MGRTVLTLVQLNVCGVEWSWSPCSCVILFGNPAVVGGQALAQLKTRAAAPNFPRLFPGGVGGGGQAKSLGREWPTRRSVSFFWKGPHHSWGSQAGLPFLPSFPFPQRNFFLPLCFLSVCFVCVVRLGAPATRSVPRPKRRLAAVPGPLFLELRPFGICCPATPSHTSASFSDLFTEKKAALSLLARWGVHPPSLLQNRGCLSGLVTCWSSSGGERGRQGNRETTSHPHQGSS